MRRSLLFLVLALAVCVPAAEPKDDTPPPAKAPPPSDRAVREWIQQLGGTSFTVRDAATKALVRAGPHIITAVREAFQSSDPEVARRARHVADEVERQSALTIEALGATIQLNSTDGSVQVIRFDPDKRTRLTADRLLDLSVFGGLEDLALDGTSVTDADAEQLGRITTLKALSLAGTGVTDAGLAHLGRLTGLESLSLDDTRVTGAGLVHLKTMKGLKSLSLAGTPITEEGLAKGIEGLVGLKSLTTLDLGRSDLIDGGLAHVKKLASLTTLSIAKTPVTDAGIEHLKGLSDLASLDVGSTALTDAGCAHLAALKRLEALGLRGTRVTTAGLKKLEALPATTLLGLAGQPQLSVKQAIEFLSRPSPPQFAVIREFDKETGIILYEEGYPNVIAEEAVVPDAGGKKRIEFYRAVTEAASVRYSLKDGPVYDGEGKKLSAEEAVKRASVGTMVLVSTDGKMIQPGFLKAIRKETLILIPPVQEPGPLTAR